jgi:hypothetical protein
VPISRAHYADLPEEDIGWTGNVPATAPARTLNDCADVGVERDRLAQARREGLAWGLFDSDAIGPTNVALDGKAEQVTRRRQISTRLQASDPEPLTQGSP